MPMGAGMPGVPMTLPKGVDINEVQNGFTVLLRGGRAEKSFSYKHNIHIAKSVDEVLELVKNHMLEGSEA